MDGVYRPSSSWQDLAGHLLAYPFPRRLVPRLKEHGVVRIRVRVDKVTRNPEPGFRSGIASSPMELGHK